MGATSGLPQRTFLSTYFFFSGWLTLSSFFICHAAFLSFFFQKQAFFFWMCPVACGTPAPRPGIEPAPLGGKEAVSSHWTTRRLSQKWTSLGTSLAGSQWLGKSALQSRGMWVDPWPETKIPRATEQLSPHTPPARESMCHNKRSTCLSQDPTQPNK